MKYLLLDTNIYIDMIVSRNKAHKADSYDLLKRLLDHDQVKIILPSIVKHEIKRNVELEIKKVEGLVKKARTLIKEIYWVNHVEEIEKYNKKINDVNGTLGNLIHEYRNNESRYIEDAFKKINELLDYKNVISIQETDKLLLRVNHRRIYKLCPFHIADKESWADALIIETLINIKDFISLNNDDSIYFITRNHKDFSKGNDKKEREFIHPHINKDLTENGLLECFNYRLNYTETLIKDLSDEIKQADIYEELIKEAEEERRAFYDDLQQDIREMERDTVGLTALSDEAYMERIIESSEVTLLINNYDQYLSSLYHDIEDVLDMYKQFVHDLENKQVADLITEINSYNSQSPFLQINFDSKYTSNEVRESVLDFVNEYLCPIDKLESTYSSMVWSDHFDIKELLTFVSLDNKVISLSVKGFLDPRDDDKDSLWVELYEGDKISTSNIEIYYGYMTFNEDGMASDGSVDSIEYDLGKVDSDLKFIVERNQDLVSDIRNNLIQIKSILSI